MIQSSHIPDNNILHCLTHDQNQIDNDTAAAAAAAKLLQSCPTLCDPIDISPPASPVPGILQVRTLEWVAISFSNAWKWKVKVKSLSRVWLLATPWTAAYQAPLSMGFSRQEYWSGLPLPSLLSIGNEFPELFFIWKSIYFSFIFTGAISNCPLFLPCSILDTFWLGVAHLSASYLLPFS